MTALAWLPPPGVGEVEAALARFATAWLREWIMAPPSLRVAETTGRQTAIAVADAPDTISLGLAACAGQADLANASDVRVLQALGTAMIADLGKRIDPCGGALRRFIIEAANEDWRVTVTVDEAFLVRERKSAAGSAKRPAVVALADALAGESVRLGCHLGAATLAAVDIGALAPGDVIVLDRAIGTSVPLTVDHKFPRTGQARLEAQAHTVRITLTEPLDLLRKN